MKTKFLILILFIFFGITMAYSQEFVREPSKTRYIKDIYQYVQEKISRNQYYVNEFRMNVGNLLWSNSKAFQSTQQYHYSFVGDDSPVLRLVIVVSKVAGKNYYSEYLYDNNTKLVYAFEKQNDSETYSYREIHAYFEEDLCINLLVDKEIIDAKKGLGQHTLKVNSFQEIGKFYSERFKEDMQEITEKE